MKRTRIKMCGTTRYEDAQFAVDLGVDALGFIFVEKSPRYISPEDARQITELLPPFVTRVGVFVDERLQDIEEIVDYLGLNAVQLHGSESPEFCRETGRELRSCAVMKAFRVGDRTSEADFRPYKDSVHGFVLDTYVKSVEGGTGQCFNWHLLEKLELKKPFILAGGLCPDNIDQALEIASPFAVDVNSGVESEPGVKDHDLLRKFFDKIAAYNANAQR